jgi:hypothetical protein
MILGTHGEPPHPGPAFGPFGTAQLKQHTVELEPEVVVQTARGVFLHDEAQSACARSAPWDRRRAPGLRVKSRFDR